MGTYLRIICEVAIYLLFVYYTFPPLPSYRVHTVYYYRCYLKYRGTGYNQMQSAEHFALCFRRPRPNRITALDAI